MSKRTAGDPETDQSPLKSGARPQTPELNGDEMEFEDEYEDEFDSDEDIVEAGVDGRPDEEREAEEQESAWSSWHGKCGLIFMRFTYRPHGP